ncbi:hypothetical protein RJT34_33534 [Clitoria ternatea]|uniref:Bifunctional inhibitor/plant lipid transfer protein/seed storage helical domain-containing protein n=1 Tax=Clitoria ternatea TaxID=43366 RepID=A0AAN9EZJ5_CLITE
MGSRTCFSLGLLFTLTLPYLALPSASASPTPRPLSAAMCPRDALKIGVCVIALNGLVNVTLGQPPVTPCCSLVAGLVDLDAGVCLCTALKLSILGIKIDLPISLSLLLNDCGRHAPRGYQCA